MKISRIASLVILVALATAPVVSNAQSVSLKLARALSYQKKYNEAIVQYRQYLKSSPGDSQSHIELGDILFWTGDYNGAIEEYDKAGTNPKFSLIAAKKKAEILAIKKDYSGAEALYKQGLAATPNDLSARIKYAQTLSYSKRYNESLAQYDAVLEKDPNNLEALQGKAEVLSWARRYKESVATYDTLLSLKYDHEVHRQKARVLGWAKQFDESIATYNEAYERTGLDEIDLEMRSKEALWNKGVLKAIKKYNTLLDAEPENVEARFDLAEVEAYQRMWRQASANYKLILDKDPSHFRASDGLERARLLWKRPSFIPEVFWNRAKSTQRDTDINRFSTGGRFEVPFGQAATGYIAYRFDDFFYANARSIKRNQETIGMDVSFTPYLWATAMYLPTEYSLANRMSHLFEASLSARPVDPIILTVMTKRDDLINNRTVFVNQLRKTDIGGQIQADIHRRWTAYGNYSYSDYNDNNKRNAFGVENLVYLMFEPKRLTVDLRFDYQDFTRTVPQYWSPQNFWGVSATIHWRHYLNEDGLYFGAKNTYYGVKYRFGVDKGSEIFNGGAVEFYHDFTKRIALQFEGFGNYGTVYYDAGALLSAVTRF